MRHQSSFLPVGLFLPLVFACTATELEVKRRDPAHPYAVEPRAAAPLGVLQAGFDPLAGLDATAEAGPTQYTCPMHPEIVRSEPGTCPICKMDLVPKKAPKDAAPAAGVHEHGDHVHGEH